MMIAINTRIRTAVVADAAIIADYNERIARETEGRILDHATLLNGVTALLQEPSRGIYFVAETTEPSPRVAGQLLITYEWSDWRNGNFWWIQSVYVAEEFRGAGVFRALFHHILDLSKSRSDVCGLRLYMDADNHQARKVYEKLGMKRTHYEMFETDFVLKDHA
jgi:GNAT superfamily N-acetyltransferase